MKKALFSLLAFNAMISCSNQAQNALPAEEFEKKLKDKNAVVLDVRTSEEFNTGYIKNAFQADWTNREQFNDRTQHLDKSKTIYVYCLSGGRSAAAADALSKKGFNVVNLEGGITAWKKAGKPVEGLTEKNKLTNEQYLDLAKSAKLVMIDFGASWCPPCKKMEPVIDDIKKNMQDKVSVKFVDGGANTALMNTWKVEALPTFIMYKEGQEVWRKQGIISSEDLVAVINRFQ
jgi:rhodanese-related sulfurtransferase